MSVSYSPLWKTLKNADKNKSFLRENGIHPTTISKMSKNEIISLDVLEKICSLLNCDFVDLICYVPEQSSEEKIYSSSINKGDIFLADLCNSQENETGILRPVVILQNNLSGSTVLVAPISSMVQRISSPTMVLIEPSIGGIITKCVIRVEQLRTINWTSLKSKESSLSEKKIKELDKALLILMGIGKKANK